MDVMGREGLERVRDQVARVVVGQEPVIRALLAALLVLAVLAGPALGADKAAQQAEIRKAAQGALDKFYKAQPSLKDEVQAAPGYALCANGPAWSPSITTL